MHAIQPAPEREYQVEVGWQRERYAVTVVFSRRFCARVRGESHPAGPVVEGGRDRGLLVLSAGDRVLRLAPPLIVQPADCRRALDVIGEVLRRQAA